jgi:hypothetical protein
MWLSFFVGLLVGLICVGGLTLGVRWLFRSRDERLPEGQRNKFALMGGAILFGQFVVAGLVLFFVPNIDAHPLALALGLLSMNLVLPLFVGKLWKK